jgi:site-specific recombinase XerD
MLLTEAIEGYLLFKATRATEQTIITDRYIFKAFLKFITPELGNAVNVRDIRPEHIRAYIEYDHDRGLSPYTAHRNYATLSTFWTWLCLPDIELANTHVVRVVLVPQLPKHIVKTLSQDDIK